jgi:hypothetical protein
VVGGSEVIPESIDQLSTGLLPDLAISMAVMSNVAHYFANGDLLRFTEAANDAVRRKAAVVAGKACQSTKRNN